MKYLLPAKTHDRTERVVCRILQIAASLHFALFYEIEHGHFFPLNVFADGRYALPYQCRMLTEWIYRYGVGLHAVQAMAHRMPGPPLLKSPYELLFLVISFLGILGALIVTQMSLRILTDDPRFSRWACFGVLYMAMFNLSLSYGLAYTLPYDIPSLFFFCLCIYLVLTRKLSLYYLVFIVATVNRETTCFLTPFFLVCEWYALENESTSRRNGWLAIHTVLQLALWVCIKSYLMHLVRGNPAEPHSGGIMTFDLARNLLFVLNPGEWPQLMGIYGFTLPLLVLGFRWIEDRRIRTACLVMVPLWFTAMMVTGVIIEVRVFDELSALLVLACSLIVYHWAAARGMRWKQLPAEGTS